MVDDKFIGKYRISSARVNWHEYGGGSYYVTICTQNREHYFGEIVDELPMPLFNTPLPKNGGSRRAASLRCGEPQMQLSLIGQYAYEQFANVVEHYPYAEIPLFVIMPNHIHALVLLDGEKTPYLRRCMTDDRNANGRDDVFPSNRRDVARRVSTTDMRNVSNMQGWLSVVIGGIKSAITRYARAHHLSFAWQSRFHDRIIRNQEEMNRMALYIEQNVAKWNEDELCR